jgi:hypothetical protein
VSTGALSASDATGSLSARAIVTEDRSGKVRDVEATLQFGVQLGAGTLTILGEANWAAEWAGRHAVMFQNARFETAYLDPWWGVRGTAAVLPTGVDAFGLGVSATLGSGALSAQFDATMLQTNPTFSLAGAFADHGVRLEGAVSATPQTGAVGVRLGAVIPVGAGK